MACTPDFFVGSFSSTALVGDGARPPLTPPLARSTSRTRRARRSSGNSPTRASSTKTARGAWFVLRNTRAS
ncbi:MULTISPECIES: hypothetical protein [unclassified Myxococcus]|uniref:hypothetical protein n=1 Tax=unclassified Myxococcus TaxID=2648731 RepID=UPI00157B619E|nr:MULTISPECIES: hypothetical protein [unclassified Myxococcus]NTX37965.1 hypothetical protein [Myxococcus sp. CA033]NTX57640.1 hypothetical protein [Myxococcus sp. CA039A]